VTATRDVQTGGRVTERTLVREREDERYQGVIVKRNDQSRRHPDDILRVAIASGLEQLQRPGWSLALSSMAAGLILGFTVMAVAVVQATFGSAGPAWLERLVTASVYPLGFVICLMGGAELFTEHTATAVYPVLDRRARVLSLLRLWVVVIGANLAGGMISAGLLTAAEPVVGARAGSLAIGQHLAAFDTASLLASALLAGWLMALGAWLILATPPTISQMLSIYIVTFLIGLGGLHHSIAGAVELFAAVFMGSDLAWTMVGRIIGLALLGNLLGGGLFVAALNYAHIRRSQAVD